MERDRTAGSKVAASRQIQGRVNERSHQRLCSIFRSVQIQQSSTATALDATQMSINNKAVVPSTTKRKTYYSDLCKDCSCYASASMQQASALTS